MTSVSSSSSTSASSLESILKELIAQDEWQENDSISDSMMQNVAHLIASSANQRIRSQQSTLDSCNTIGELRDLLELLNKFEQRDGAASSMAVGGNRTPAKRSDSVSDFALSSQPPSFSLAAS
jgi:hypothetical protein